ncbi:alpha/beta fold hydrolase [Streptomyces sp. WMMB303]|uniref:alpha/beta fold hydrolase n=1 Tax=Streptomyces sp. WMMB303 TaxID=3034154 RepID=UPI0023EA9561|nr:alpha/beta fold hydrolase [Streptomyces sp. WMMB303]MDF4251185.1 alpha/beta fold hydrolase [Streptomyces sp. WMMB303]
MTEKHTAAAAAFPSLDVHVHGSGPALLLAHGAGGGIEANFGQVLDDLASDHTLIGPHYPGAGGSPRAAGPLDLDVLVDAVVEAAVSRGHERFTVLGESLGTVVALRAAARHPERVTGLVLTAGFAVADPLLEFAAALVTRLGRDGEWDAVARVATHSALLAEDTGELTAEALEDTVAAAREAMPPGMVDHFDLVRRVDVRADLAGIRVPALVAVPTGDRLVLPDSSRRLAAALPDAALVEIPGGAHVLGEQDRKVWLGHVREFLAGLPEAAGRAAQQPPQL